MQTFEKSLVTGAVGGTVLIALFASSLQGGPALSFMGAQVLLYGLVVCAGFVFLSALGAGMFWYYRGAELPFGILGMLTLGILFAGYAVTALYGLETGNGKLFLAFVRNHLVGLMVPSAIGFVVYFLCERTGELVA